MGVDRIDAGFVDNGISGGAKVASGSGCGKVGAGTVSAFSWDLAAFCGGRTMRRPVGELTRVRADSKLLKLHCRGSSLVERRPEKAGVASSILAPGTSFAFYLL